MNYLPHLLSVILVASVGAALADAERVDVTINAPKEKVEECKTKKCMLVTAEEVFDAIKRSYVRGRDEAEDDMDTQGCKRGNT